MSFRQFNHLNVPEYWERYFTKYPQGMTILESLFEWVSQVDSMVDNVNNWNTYLAEFVKTFDKELQSTVTQTLTDWENSGFLKVIITEALQTQIDNLENDTNKKLTDFSVVLNSKVGGGKKAEPEDLSATTLGLISGNGSPININSIPQNNSVDINKLSTTIGSTLFDMDNEQLFTLDIGTITEGGANAPSDYRLRSNGYTYVRKGSIFTTSDSTIELNITLYSMETASSTLYSSGWFDNEYEITENAFIRVLIRKKGNELMTIPTNNNLLFTSKLIVALKENTIVSDYGVKFDSAASFVDDYLPGFLTGQLPLTYSDWERGAINNQGGNTAVDFRLRTGFKKIVPGASFKVDLEPEYKYLFKWYDENQVIQINESFTDSKLEQVAPFPYYRVIIAKNDDSLIDIVEGDYFTLILQSTSSQKEDNLFSHTPIFNALSSNGSNYGVYRLLNINKVGLPSGIIYQSICSDGSYLYVLYPPGFIQVYTMKGDFVKLISGLTLGKPNDAFYLNGFIYSRESFTTGSNSSVTITKTSVTNWEQTSFDVSLPANSHAAGMTLDDGKLVIASQLDTLPETKVRLTTHDLNTLAMLDNKLIDTEQYGGIQGLTSYQGQFFLTTSPYSSTNPNNITTGLQIDQIINGSVKNRILNSVFTEPEGTDAVIFNGRLSLIIGIVGIKEVTILPLY